MVWTQSDETRESVLPTLQRLQVAAPVFTDLFRALWCLGNLINRKCQAATVPGEGVLAGLPTLDLTSAVKTEAAFRCTLLHIVCAHEQGVRAMHVCGGPGQLAGGALSTEDSGLASGAFPR